MPTEGSGVSKAFGFSIGTEVLRCEAHASGCGQTVFDVASEKQAAMNDDQAAVHSGSNELPCR